MLVPSRTVRHPPKSDLDSQEDTVSGPWAQEPGSCSWSPTHAWFHEPGVHLLVPEHWHLFMHLFTRIH